MDNSEYSGVIIVTSGSDTLSSVLVAVDKAFLQRFQFHRFHKSKQQGLFSDTSGNYNNLLSYSSIMINIMRHYLLKVNLSI